MPVSKQAAGPFTAVDLGENVIEVVLIVDETAGATSFSGDKRKRWDAVLERE
jgi:hypothetical protein